MHIGRWPVFGVLVVCTLLAASQAQAEEKDWAERMFSELKYDFGNVASGSDARHRISIKNIYKEQVRIVHVGTTCGCTAAKPSHEVLETGETAYVEIVMNTVKFKHEKNSNVDVSLAFTDANGVSTSKTVRIPISAYIRSDIVVDPGNVDFGIVDAGAGARREARVSYAGRSSWAISGVEVNHEFLEATIDEKQRNTGVGGDSIVTYELVVQVKPSAPVGVIRDKINLVTNDQANPIVPVLVEARVEPDIAVTPRVLTLGEVSSGAERTYTVIVRGKKPFSIERIECESDLECFKVRLTKDPKTVHVLPLTFTPPENPGAFKEEFTITVEGRPQPITFSAEGEIVADASSNPRS